MSSSDCWFIFSTVLLMIRTMSSILLLVGLYSTFHFWRLLPDAYIRCYSFINLIHEFRLCAMGGGGGGQGGNCPHDFQFSFCIILKYNVFACQLSGHAVMSMMIIPLPHYDYFRLAQQKWVILQSLSKRLDVRSPPPPECSWRHLIDKLYIDG